MSNNHSHDNIYSILGKLEALKPTAEEKRFALVKEIRESVEAQGSILAGVDSVQQRLAEQFAKSKIEEKAVSQAQQKFMGMVHAAQKGSKAASPAVAKVAKSMGKKDATDFAATKHKGLPQHVGEGTCNECGMTEGSCEHTKMEEVKVKPTVELVKKIRARLAQLNDTFYQQKGYEMEPEEAIEQVADEFNISTSQVDKLLQDERFFEEKATTHKGGEVSHKDGVTRHTKKDYPGYQSDDDEDKDDENKGKRGRPRKHAKKADTGEKRGRGRPSKHSTGEKSSKDSLPFSSKNKMGHDPFGRVKPDAEKTVAKKDSKKSVAESMDNLAHRLTEGVNFANLLKEKHQTVDEMLAELSNDMKVFKETGHCSELLRDCMEIKGYHGKMVADEAAQVPSKMDQFDRPDPFAHVKDAPKTPMGIPGNLPASQIPGKSALLKGQGRNYYEEDSLASELDELAKLAGLSEVSRGEYIKQQDAAAEKSGKDKFNAFGQIFNTDEITEEPNEGNAFTAGLADDDVAIGDKIPGTNAIKTKDIDEAKVDVADAPEAVNKPRPKYASIKTITTQGDDMNREKSQDPATANKAANPFTNKGNRVSEATLSLEAQLAAEYESIKKVN